jgi:hypothetical protein
MPPSNLVRLGGGLANVGAGVLLLLGHILNLGGDPEYGTVFGASLVLTAHVLLVFALVALYAAQAEQSGLMGSLGMVLSVVGTTLVSGVVLVEIAGASGAEVVAVLAVLIPAGFAIPTLALSGAAGLIVIGLAVWETLAYQGRVDSPRQSIT